MRKLKGKLPQILAAALVMSSMASTGIFASTTGAAAESGKAAGGLEKLEAGRQVRGIKGEVKPTEEELEAGKDQEIVSEAVKGAAVTGDYGDNITWSLDKRVLTISGTGKMERPLYTYYYETPWYEYRDQIQEIVIEEGVTGVSSYAFYKDYEVLRKVTIADSVEIIGEGAFSGASRLSTLNLGNGVTAIEKSAFSNCRLLEAVEIPDSVTTMDTDVFFGCDALETVSIGRGLTSIPVRTFSSCRSLAEVTIPGNIKTIGDAAFSYCEGMRNVTIEDGVEIIGSGAFGSCKGLESVEIPDSVWCIQEGAFSYCDNMRTVTIGIGVTTIDKGAFEGCGSLADVYYGGDEAQWNDIFIEDPDGTNKPLLDARFHRKGQLESLELDIEETTLEEGTSFQLTVNKNPENADADLADVVWVSSNVEVAAVEGTGATVKVVAKKAGSADITAKLEDKTVVCKVTVTAAPKPPVVVELESLKLDVTEKTLEEGTSFRIKAGKTPENANADLADAVWTSSNPAVAAVEGKGAEVKVVAKAAGTADITVKLENKTAVCKVTVTAAPKPPVVVELESIELDVTEKTVEEGTSFRIKAGKTPENADADLADAVWTSSNSAVAAVEGKGAEVKVVAKAAGTADITVKLENKTAVCKVTVTAAPKPPVVVELKSIELDVTEKTLEEGTSFQLKAVKIPENADADLADMTWISSNPDVAAVEGKGAEVKVSAKTAGTADITAKLGDKTAVCKVTVTAVPKPPAVVELESIKLNATEKSLKVGDTFQLTVIKNPENADNADLSDVKWTSSNTKVATVDQKGKVTAAGAGTAKITAELKGKTAACTVTVRRISNSGGSTSSGVSGGSTGGSTGSRKTSSSTGADTWSKDDKGWKYRKSDNTWASNGWHQLSYNGILEWYYFSDQGYMVTGWINDQGRKYYLNPISDGTQGKMLTGWQRIDGKWYYFNEVSDGTKGALMTNAQIGEYYVNAEGVWTE